MDTIDPRSVDAHAPCCVLTDVTGFMNDNKASVTMQKNVKIQAKAKARPSKAPVAPITDPNAETKPPQPKSAPSGPSADYIAVEGFLRVCRKFIVDEEKYEWVQNLCRAGAVHPDTGYTDADVNDMLNRSRA